VRLPERDIALSLEPIVWHSLEHVATREGTTTEDLIDKVASEVLRKRLYDALWAFTTTYMRIDANADLAGNAEWSGSSDKHDQVSAIRPGGNPLKRALAACEIALTGE